MLKKFILNFLFPKQNINYFAIYLSFWKEIVFVKKQSSILTIKLIILIIVYQVVKYVLIELFNPSTIKRIVLYDCFNLILPNQLGLSLMVAAVCSMTGWLLQLCYLKGEKHSFFVLEDMLFKNQAKVLIWPQYKGQNACKYLIKIANRLLLLGPVLMSITCKF